MKGEIIGTIYDNLHKIHWPEIVERAVDIGFCHHKHYTKEYNPAEYIEEKEEEWLELGNVKITKKCQLTFNDETIFMDYKGIFGFLIYYDSYLIFRR